MTSQLLVALGTITDGRNGTDTPEVNTCFDFYALPAAGIQRLCGELSSHLVGVESTSEIILLTRHISFFQNPLPSSHYSETAACRPGTYPTTNVGRIKQH